VGNFSGLRYTSLGSFMSPSFIPLEKLDWSQVFQPQVVLRSVNIFFVVVTFPVSVSDFSCFVSLSGLLLVLLPGEFGCRGRSGFSFRKRGRRSDIFFFSALSCNL